jgi:hypothetical protein
MRIATDTKTRIESALPGNEIFSPETNGPKRRSRMIVQRHGGQLTAASDGNNGAGFQFVLPTDFTDAAHSN